MIAANDKETAFLARSALVLWFVGLLLPFVIAAMILASSGPNLSPATENTAASLGFGFGFVALALALAFGIVGRRHLTGRIAIRGAIAILAVAVALMVAWSFFGGVGHPRPLPPRPVRIMTGQTRPPTAEKMVGHDVKGSVP